MNEKELLIDDYFLNCGYKRYGRTGIDPSFTLYNFQKCFSDRNGKKYFINIHKLSNKWMREWDKQQEWYTPYSYTFSCQLYKKDTHAPVNMEFFSDWTIEQVEEFVEKLFQNGELDYYERFYEDE